MLRKYQSGGGGGRGGISLLYELRKVCGEIGKVGGVNLRKEKGNLLKI